LTDMSNTGDWKLIPFAQNMISRDQMNELIKKQNRYLHEVTVMSFINLGLLEGSFRQEVEQEGGGSKRKSSTDTMKAPLPVPNKKVAENAADFQSTSELKGVSDNNEEDSIMEEGGSARMDGKIFRIMRVILLLQK